MGARHGARRSKGQVRVLDARGRDLTPCSLAKAERLLGERRAVLVSREPLVIRLPAAVDIPEPPQPERLPLAGHTLLLHICCGPCATYVVEHLRGLGAGVVGLWYNPNISPGHEHARRRQALARLAGRVGLPLLWLPDEGDETVSEAALAGEHRPGRRCLGCYRLRLERTATEAVAYGIELISTTLLISPYQDLEAIGRIGSEVAAEHGIAFHHENLRRGYARHHHLAREHGLYRQDYCGCRYSLAEARARRAQAK